MNQREYQQNLSWGKNALRYVKYTCVIGSSNKEEDTTRTSGWSGTCVEKMRREHDPIVSQATNPADIINIIADSATTNRCGNCEEQACVAFEYLRNTLHATPVELFVLANQRLGGGNIGVSDGDHAFVVIGRRNTLNPGTLAARLDIQHWNNETVICDPWANDVYPAFDFSVKSVCGAAWHRLFAYHRV